MTKTMNHITTEQIKAIHAALASAGMMDQKRELIAANTNGRTNSTKAMTFDEARRLIKALNDSGADTRDRMRKKILAICHDMQWYVPNTKKLDFKRINDFLTSNKGTGKTLNAMNAKELNKAVSAFQGIRRHYLTQQTAKNA